MPRFVLCTLGDLLLDVIVRLEQPLEAGTDATAQTRTGAGGQAANVAAWAAALGAEARFVGKRGADPGGEVALRDVESRGVEVVGPVEEGRNGVVVSLVGADGGRTMISDRGVAPGLRAEELEIAWFQGCDWLHLSGYSLFASPIDEAAAKAAGAVKAAGGRVSGDLSSASAIEAFCPELLRAPLEVLGADVVFANEDEERALGGPAPATVTVLKRGAAGILLRDGGEQAIAAHPAEVVDTTGAGDALAAGYLVGGPELALETAARCVAQLGAMPPRAK